MGDQPIGMRAKTKGTETRCDFGRGSTSTGHSPTRGAPFQKTWKAPPPRTPGGVELRGRARRDLLAQRGTCGWLALASHAIMTRNSELSAPQVLASPWVLRRRPLGSR